MISNLDAEFNKAMNIKGHFHEVHEEGYVVMGGQVVGHTRTTPGQHL